MMCVASRFPAPLILIHSIVFVSRVLCAQEEGPRVLLEPPSDSRVRVETGDDSTTDVSANYQNEQSNDDFEIDYPGRELDAEWREEAAERIEEHRKAELTVLVTDAEGKPIKEASVGIWLKQHSFRFGTVVSVEFSLPIIAAPPEPTTELGVHPEDAENAIPRAALSPIAEMPAGSRFSEKDRSMYREKLFALFNTALPKEESAIVHERLTAWLRSRGFLFDADEVQVRTVPATFTISDLIPPEKLIRDLEQLEKETDLPLAARHFSLSVDPENSEQLELQADYTRDYLTALFSIPKMREISIDGFWAPASGVDGWALFEEDWNMRPVGHVYSDLLKRVWCTNEEALTDAAGKVKIRGFLGTYRVSVVVGSRMKTITAFLPEGGAVIKVPMH